MRRRDSRHGYGQTRARSRSQSLDRRYHEPKEPIKSSNMMRRDSRYEDVRTVDRHNRDAEEHWSGQKDRVSVSERFESDRYGRTSDSVLTGEYMDRSYYHDGDEDRVRLLRLSHLSEDIPCHEASTMKFQWSNQPEDKMDARNLYRSSGLEQLIGRGSDIYRTSSKKSYGGSGFSESSTRPRRGPVLLNGNFLSPLPSLDLGFEKNDDFFRDWERAHLGIGSSSTSYNNQYKSPMSSKDDFLSLQSEGLSLNDSLGLNRIEDKMVTEAVGHDGHGRKPYQHFGVPETSLNGLLGQRRPTALFGPMEVLAEGFNYSQEPRNGNDNITSLPTEAIVGYDERDRKHSLEHFGHPQNTLNGMLSPRMATTRLSPIQNMDEGFKNPQMLRSGNADMGSSLPFDFILSNMETTVPENYRCQGFLKPNSSEPIVDRGHGTESHFENLNERTFPSNDNLTTTSYLRDLEQKLLGTRSSLVEYETAEHKGPEPLSFGRAVSFERDAGASSYLPDLDRLAMSKHGLGLHETDGGLNRPLVADTRITEHMEGKQRSNISHSHLFSNNDPYNDAYNKRQIVSFSSGDEQRTEQRIYQDLSLREEDQFNVAGHTNQPCSEKFVPSHRLPATMRLGVRSSKHFKSARRDLKKRLGPVPPSPISKPSSKKLKPGINVHSREMSCVSRTHHSQERDLPNVRVKREITEPPEDSNEFKQRVRNAFFKFVKSLNGNPTMRREYVEQRGNITLRCNVCGSHSKEFIDTLSLLQHAFNSLLLGSRAEHLGFHKALCVLMGWSSEAGPRNLWVRETLCKTEALALKEDLIIWPPVVIIHNSSITKGNHEEWVIISIQKLEALLKCMGFDKEKTKVQRGDSENQSIMIATFNATLSGLKEAERLHRLYADKKHGRVELQQIISSGHNNTNDEMAKVSADKVVNVLYGYLGISEDLEKLDSEHRRRSVIKSRNEIQAIADATS